MTKDYDYAHKIIFVGDASVGKSSILTRYVDNTYGEPYLSTIGVDFKLKTIETTDDKIIRLHLWDTAGQEKFYAIVSTYYRGAHCIVLTFDLSDYESFKNLRYWMEQCDKYASKSALRILVGTKNDVDKEKIKIDEEEIKKFCNDNKMDYYAISAKKNEGMTELFNNMINVLNEKADKEEKEKTVDKIIIKEEKKLNSCCG